MQKRPFPHTSKYLEHEKASLERHPLFLGIELEVAHDEYGCREDCECDGCYEGYGCEHSDAADYPHSPLFEAGYDCSIEPGGYEFRTPPISWEYAKAHMDVVSDWLTELDQFDFFTGRTGNCGMHVHLNRGVLLPFQTYKLSLLFCNNKHKIYRFSRRDRHSFDQWCSLRTMNDGDQKEIVKENARNCKTRGSYRGGRSALSFCRGDTVEFRVFNGTLDPKIFWGNVEFVVASYRFSRDSILSDMNFDKFSKYVKSHKKEYKNLHETIDIVFDNPQSN